MLILGIESSCDETAAAVVEDGERILSSIVASQILTHEKYGGVVPELASREHLRRIVPVVDEALKKANVSLAKIEAVAVTEGPGLIGSLLVGLVYGKAVALSLGKPLVGVNHLEGHIHAVMLENKMTLAAGRTSEVARTPAVTLVVSGGRVALAAGPPALYRYEVQCAAHYARLYGVPAKLVEAVIDVESSWNPLAVSPKGAVGLMQLMPATAFALRVPNRFQIEDNIHGGVAYLAWLIRLFRGDLRLALAAYIAGS